MKNILFPTAYATQSKAAFRYAQKLAQYFEASITLVHIYQAPELGASISADDRKGHLEQRWNQEMEKLKTFAQELSGKQFHDINLDFIATDGAVLPQLMDIQSENNYDLVVMGMRRHSTLDRVFGNTTYNFIDEVKCPLLLIPPDAHFMSINKILYGTAFKVGDQKTIEYLLDWCLAFDGKLDLLHVHRAENAYEASVKMDELLAGFQAEKKEGIIKGHLREGNIHKVVDQTVHVSGTDLMAIHRRKQGFLQEMTDGSLTKALSEDLHIPLLVLKS